MALIVEDGTGLANADSYISLADARTFAEAYGITLPTDDTEAEIAMRNGAVYVDMSESSFSGERLNTTQALAWPRTNAYKCSGTPIASDSVPAEMSRAQVYAAEVYGQGTNPRPSITGQEVKKERVDAIEVEYFESGANGTVIITSANDAMAPLVCVTRGRFSVRTLRV